MASNVHWYASRLNGRKMAWPVEVLRRGEGVTYVRGLAGRFRGQEFGAVSYEVTSYLPTGYQLAPGASAFLPPTHSDRQRLRRLGTRITALINREDAPSAPSREQIRRMVTGAERLLREVEREAAAARERNPRDQAWTFYAKDIARAKQNLEDAGRYGTGSDLRHALFPMRQAVQMIEGAIERTSRDATRATRSRRAPSRRSR